MKTNSNKQILDNLAKCLNQDIPFNQVGKMMARSFSSGKSSKHPILSPKPGKQPQAMKAKINKNKA